MSWSKLSFLIIYICSSSWCNKWPFYKICTTLTSIFHRAIVSFLIELYKFMPCSHSDFELYYVYIVNSVIVSCVQCAPHWSEVVFAFTWPWAGYHLHSWGFVAHWAICHLLTVTLSCMAYSKFELYVIYLQQPWNVCYSLRDHELYVISSQGPWAVCHSLRDHELYVISSQGPWAVCHSLIGTMSCMSFLTGTMICMSFLTGTMSCMPFPHRDHELYVIPLQGQWAVCLSLTETMSCMSFPHMDHEL